MESGTSSISMTTTLVTLTDLLVSLSPVLFEVVVTVATLTIEPVAFTKVMTDTLTLSFDPNDPISNTRPPLTKIKPSGNISAITTSSAVSGPLLVTVIVHVMVSPT